MKKKNTMATKEVLAIAMVAFGGIVVAFAVVVEPSGELHGSVLAFWGETLGTALLLMGLTKKQITNVNANDNDNAN